MKVKFKGLGVVEEVVVLCSFFDDGLSKLFFVILKGLTGEISFEISSSPFRVVFGSSNSDALYFESSLLSLTSEIKSQTLKAISLTALSTTSFGKNSE